MSDGIGCECGARSDGDCGCQDVDWTPHEVYDLRAKIKALEEENARWRQLSAILEEERDALSSTLAVMQDKLTLIKQHTKWHRTEGEINANRIAEDALATHAVELEDDNAKN